MTSCFVYRLCRLVEVLGGRTGDDSCLKDAKFPADSRAARVHNVQLALDAAAACGVELPGRWNALSGEFLLLLLFRTGD